MKLSFCTTCMNRVEHLKETLPHNIKLINKYNSELVLVNYDSKDDIHEYIINNYNEYIENKTLLYLNISNKSFFDPRHAKNIAHKNSTGDVLINLDADNFLTDNIISEIINDFNSDINYLIQSSGGNDGFIVMSRDNFFKLGGYNELMKGYGIEDVDLVARGYYLLKLKFKYLTTVETIKHSDNDRTCNFELKDFSQDYNRDMHKYYLNEKIINPNLYNNIEWGII